MSKDITTINYGELLAKNSYTQRWADVPEDTRRYITEAYAGGGSAALAMALAQTEVSVPLNTVRGYMVRAGVKVKGMDFDYVKEVNSAPRIYSVDVAKEAPRCVFIGDEQVPFNDKLLTQQVYNMVAEYAPDVVFLLGDMLDCYTISRFTRDPRRRLSYASEIDAGNEYLDFVDSVVDKSAALKVFIKGNHEKRAEDYLLREAPALLDLPALRIENLLNLGKRGYAVYEYGQSVSFRGFVATHGWYVGPSAAERMGRELGLSGISGHNHQTSQFTWTDSGGSKTWYINPTLMEINAVNPDYVIGFPNWTQGFTLGQWAYNEFTLTQVVRRGRGLVAPWGPRLYEV